MNIRTTWFVDINQTFWNLTKINFTICIKNVSLLRPQINNTRLALRILKIKMMLNNLITLK